MRLAALLLWLLSVPAFGAVQFHFHTTKSGEPPVRFSGTGWIDGGSFRMELEQGNHPFFRTGAVVINQNRGALIAVVDREARTYFMRTTDRMRGPVSTMNAPWEVGAREISVRFRPQPEREVIAGQQTQRHTLDVAYTIWMLVEDTVIKARVRGRSEMWLSSLNHGGAIPYGFHYVLKTGFPEVDRRIERAVRGKGLPMRQTVTASRSIGGAEPINETMTTEIDSLQVIEPAASLFHVEAGYRYVEPSVTLPERDQ
jgi:hypothetical protein